MKDSRAERLRAVSTPLSSIFGSGFLVVVPILAAALGPLAVVGMLLVSVIAFLIGEVIRFNIRHAEPLLNGSGQANAPLMQERLGDFALVLAYIVSISLYLRILASFVLGSLDLDSDLNENLLTTGAVILIVAVGLIGGLSKLLKLETLALVVTLALIVLLIVGFGIYDVRHMLDDSIQWPDASTYSAWKITTLLAGMLIVVQGFETSRYLGATYSTDLRVSTSRQSQIISTVVYLLFVALATPLMHFLSEPVKENDLIQLAGRVLAILPAFVVLSAILSQFSAAVADTATGAENLCESTKQHVSMRLALVGIGILAIALTWSASTLFLVALASRAFALYYFLQCLVAYHVATKTSHRVGIALVAALLGFVVIFAKPVG